MATITFEIITTFIFSTVISVKARHSNENLTKITIFYDFVMLTYSDSETSVLSSL